MTNYIRAMEHGLARLDNLPISVRLLSEVHGVLLTSGRVERALGVSNPGALNLIRGLEAAETVTEVQRVSGRAKRWVATDVLRLLDPQADPRLGPGPR